MADKLTVLLVDDHALVRKGFRRMLEDDAAISIVGEASEGLEAVRLALELKPKVVVMDLDSGKTVGEIADTPGVHGIALANDLGRGFVSNGRDNTVSIFDPSTLKTSTVPNVRPKGPTAPLMHPCLLAFGL